MDRTLFKLPLTGLLYNGVVRLLVLMQSLAVSASAQEIGGVLADTSNFLDSGLATLGALSAWTNAAVRGRLDFECALREATYVHCYTLQLSPVESIWAFIADADALVVTYALFTVGKCKLMDKALAWWLVNRTEATVEIVCCKWYNDATSECDGNPAAEPHACGCLLIPSTFVDRHSLWERDVHRCKSHDDGTQQYAVVYCRDCVMANCHGLLSPEVRDRDRDYWEAISDCLTALAYENTGGIILADADLNMATVALLRRSAISGDEQARNAQTALFDVLDDPERIGSAEFEKAASDNSSVSAGLAARRIMRSYVGDASGTGSTLELLFPKMYVGSDSRLFAAGFPIGRYSLWRLTIILAIRGIGPVAVLALWIYFILSGDQTFLYSRAYTKRPASWAVWYSAAVAVLQTLTGCTICYYLYALSSAAECVKVILRVCLITLAQIGYLAISTMYASRQMISWRVLVVAQEILITGYWFVCCLMMRNNPRSVMGNSTLDSCIKWWYSTTFLQLVAITTMGGQWK
ncbi:hypothetical protein GOP47_0029832 [Adiantum capillus-veneris]|nr:hypothetical protein GOP47_0029832 [Adiantum capillus-veneris]